MPLVGKDRRRFLFKDFIIVLIAVILSVSAGVAVFLYLKKDVVIVDNGNSIMVKTMKNTVSEVLEQAGIIVNPEDYISRPPGARLLKMTKNEIIIKRAVPVSILVDGRKADIMTYRDTVREMISEGPVKLEPDDRLEGANFDSEIISGMEIKVVRVKKEILTEETPVPFNVVTRENNKMDKGAERVAVEGKEGIREKLYRVIFEDGKEIARELIKDNIAMAPIDKIIEIGTILNHKTARGDVIRYKKVLDMKATAYTASFKDTGKHPDHPEFGITYTGVRVKKGIIAVDPKVIPLGTKVYVEVAGSTPDYGYALAADIGGAVKGNIIDLYLDDQETVDRWGCKRVKVYILLD